MSEELPRVSEGKLVSNGVVISDYDTINELGKSGYGEREGKKLLLKNYEALFLLYLGKLRIIKKGEDLNIDNLVTIALKDDRNAWTRFLIYRDLRSRGYVPKEGFGFGVDFRVYDRGDFGNKPAKYVVFGLNEGTEMTVRYLNTCIDQITRMGKETIVAVIERRGEVIYYKGSKTRFKEL